MMTAKDWLLSTGVRRAQPVLNRFGILGAPLRMALDGQRSMTVDRPLEEVQRFLSDPSRASMLFARAAAVDDAVPETAPEHERTSVSWKLDARGRAWATMSPGPNGATELTIRVHLDKMGDHGRPRYADNAGVIAARAVHRAKSAMETGEVPSLAGNPAGRSSPDPYGD